MTRALRLKFYLSDVQIIRHYFGDFDLNSKYNSPFRDDPNPSLAFKLKSGKLMWTDFGLTTDNIRDGIGFVQQLYDLSRKEAINKIFKDIIKNKATVVKKATIEIPLKVPYEFTIGDIQDFEMKYWSKLYFTRELLKFYNVHSLISLRRVGKKIWGTEIDSPTFIYLFSKKGAFKAYRPLDKFRDKFRGQNNGDILEGYEQLPKTGSHLIITSSLKDTMTLRNMGVLALNPTSENSKQALLNKAKELNQRFKKIYILFDYDKAGIDSSYVLSKQTGWEVINLFLYDKTNKKYIKDPSDSVMVSNTYFYLINLLSKYNLMKYHV